MQACCSRVVRDVLQINSVSDITASRLIEPLSSALVPWSSSTSSPGLNKQQEEEEDTQQLSAAPPTHTRPSKSGPGLPMSANSNTRERRAKCPVRQAAISRKMNYFPQNSPTFRHELSTLAGNVDAKIRTSYGVLNNVVSVKVPFHDSLTEI
ncbi:hypothetical protein ElyMa_004063000 [Elysia marginata]|uniref:Uncharacterized protein n=1 Tax=Elysia marginata TaxID=1093978 RepID=A0AAV4G6J0_9GAST|nr:hypothetical protein ElyMa_004063000 [Elysia marginata]